MTADRRDRRRVPVWLLGLLLGPVYTVVLAWATRAQPWTREHQELGLFLNLHAETFLAFSLACGSVAWILNRWIGDLSLRSCLGAALIALPLGTIAFVFFVELLGCLESGVIEGERILRALFLMPFLSLIVSPMYWLPAFPLTWLSVLLLRLASARSSPAAGT